jgi:hypothetical protein
MSSFLILQLIQMVRFILLQYLNRLKEDAWNIHHRPYGGSAITPIELKRYQTLGWRIRMIRKLVSWWICLLFVLFVTISWVIVEIVVLLISQAATMVECRMGEPDSIGIVLAMQIVNIVYFGSIGFIALSFLFVDFLIFLSRSRRKWLVVFDYFRQDNFFFRSEYLITYFWVIAVYIAILVSFFEKFQMSPVTLAGIICWAIPGIFVYFGGIVAISLFSQCMSYRKLDPNSIHDLLSETTGRDLFFKFSKDEWNHENILLYEEILHLKEISQSDRKKHFFRLVDTYFKIGSAIEVNLPYDFRRQIINEATENITDVQILLLLNLTETEVINNLRETFLRFTTTIEYYNWVKQLVKTTSVRVNE